VCPRPAGPFAFVGRFGAELASRGGSAVRSHDALEIALRGALATFRPRPELVQTLSERWGTERAAAGGTRVWARLLLTSSAKAVIAG
jgi:hypothetical protein